MFYQRITAAEQIAPKWVVCDREEDISDIWVEEMDPQNEDGAIVTAYLHSAKYDDTMEIKGICIDDDSGRTYWDREKCMERDGLFSALSRVESLAMQAPGYGSDDRYDEWKEAQV